MMEQARLPGKKKILPVLNDQGSSNKSGIIKINFMRIKILRLLLFILLVLVQEKIIAQPFNLTESVQPVELNFSEYKKDGEDKAKGRISLNNLTQDKDTMYYFIKGLSMYAPTYFSLNATDPGADIKVNLCKENWHTAHRTGNVRGSGIWKSNFKTEGDFGIMVIANKKPVKYVLLVWAGDEMKIEMPSVFTTAGKADINGGGWLKKNRTLVITGGVALLIILFLVVKLKNKKGLSSS